MADLKVKILADSNQAIQNVNNFNDVTKDTFKSLSKMQNELNKLGYYQNQKKILPEGSEGYKKVIEQLDKLEKAGLDASKIQEQFRYILEKTNNSFLTQGTGIQEYTKMLKNTDSWIQKLSASTRNSEFINSLYEYRTEIEKTIENLKEQEDAQKKVNEVNVDILKATALGDKSFILKQEYSQLDKELTKLLTTEGKITPKTKELANRMVALEKEMRKASKTPINERMANLVKSFVSAQAVVWAVSKAFRTIVNVLKESAEAASKAEETANLFNTTFETIQGTANKVAINLSSSLGMANSTIQQSLGLFGDLAMGYGQTQDAALNFAESAVQTGLDIMSFKNISGDTTEVLQTMASGLAGNFENFRKWGIIVTQAEVKTRLQQKGLDKLTGSSLQFAKVQETLAIVQEKSKNAQGDLQKTLESTENITRRVSEANKQLLESMGSGVNEVLNPIRKLWIDIAENINKANLAMKLYKEGQTDINVYDLNNSKDWASFVKAVNGSNIKLYNDTGNITPTKAGINENVLNNLKLEMALYGATVEDVKRAAEQLKITLSDTVITSLEEFSSQLKEDIEIQQENEKRRNFLQNQASSSANFVDSIANINGVNLKSNYASDILNWVGPLFYSSEKNLNDALSQISIDVSNAIQSATSSLNATSWQNFSNPLDVALGIADSSDALEEKLKSIYSLYEEVYNLRYKDGQLTEDERAELEQIANIYIKTKKEIEDINKLKEMRSKIDSMGKSNEELMISISELGMSDLDKAIASLQRELMAIAFSDLTTEEKSLAKAFYDRRIELLKEEDTAKKLLEAEKAYTNKIEDYKDRILEYRISNATLGMTSEQADIYKLENERQTALADISSADEKKQRETNAYFDELIKLVKDKYDFEKTQSFNESVKSFNEYLTSLQGDAGYTPYKQLADQSKFYAKLDEYFKEQKITEESRKTYYEQFLNVLKEQKKNEAKAIINSGLGESFDFYKGFETLFSGGGFGDLLTTLASLVTQTEAFAKLSSLLSDHVVPVLDALLRPLLPVIEMIGQSIAGIVEFFAAILYPLINEVSQALTLVFGTIKSVIDFIVDGAKWVIGQIYMFFQNFINGIISMLNSIPFVNIGYLRGGAIEDWSRIDAVKNFENNMAEVLRTVQDIRDTNMDIADNTSEKNSESLKTIEDLYKRGILTSTQRDAEIASLAGKYYDATKLFSGGSYRSTGYETTISYGDINITVNGSNANAADIAKEVKKVLEGQQRAGRNLISA